MVEATGEVKQGIPYHDWQARQNIPSVRGLLIEDLNEVELKPWDLMTGNGSFIDLGLGIGLNGGGWVLEIPPEGSLEPMRHMFDEGIYITQGRGATTIWREGGAKQMVEWQQGSLLAIPLNAWHQHFNTGPTPARFYSMNTFGDVMNRYNSEEFAFANTFDFVDRYAGQDDYYTGDGELLTVPREQYKVWRTNFVPDARNMELHSWEARGAGGLNVMLEMAETVCPHISQFPVGTYKKAHVHGRQQTGFVQSQGGAKLLILGGEGFTLTWESGTQDIQQHNWKENSLVVAPSSHYHQHFNAGGSPARYLAAIGIGTRRNRNPYQKNPNDVSEGEGGTQVEYQNESAEVHKIFEGELAKHGVTCDMAGLSPFCTTK
jgi:oxalate decarboxylase/phosphoglucose isomerase-like protein (cupin superfamily)